MYDHAKGLFLILPFSTPLQVSEKRVKALMQENNLVEASGYTLHPAPCTLHPQPCLMHPQPHTLHQRRAPREHGETGVRDRGGDQRDGGGCQKGGSPPSRRPPCGPRERNASVDHAFAAARVDAPAPWQPLHHKP